jgi:hypothetical protein
MHCFYARNYVFITTRGSLAQRGIRPYAKNQNNKNNT